MCVAFYEIFSVHFLFQWLQYCYGLAMMINQPPLSRKKKPECRKAGHSFQATQLGSGSNRWDVDSAQTCLSQELPEMKSVQLQSCVDIWQKITLVYYKSNNI